jgi:hypothetical protein
MALPISWKHGKIAAILSSKLSFMQLIKLCALEFNVHHLQCVTSKTACLAVGEHVVKQTSHSACFFPL